MFTVRKKFRLEIAHVLEDAYSNECKSLHGYSMVIEIFCQSEKLNENGMVLDFKKLKEVLSHLMDQIDHSVILDNTSTWRDNLGLSKMFLVPFNPTAENLAKLIYRYAKDRVPILSKVRVHETETGYAEYFEE
jgi:6-pyruvoyltetrahydropterin/6-carboxytetrahydropterin synthase